MNANHLPVPPWEKELEADRFAGYVIKKLETAQYGTSLAEAIEEEYKIHQVEGSAAHPPRPMRIQAVTEGYNNGSPCVGR